MVEVDEQVFHEQEIEKQVCHGHEQERSSGYVREAVKNRGSAIAPRYVPQVFAEEISSTSLLSSSLPGNSCDDEQHSNDNYNDNDISINDSQRASAVQAPAIAMQKSRRNRLDRRNGKGIEGMFGVQKIRRNKHL